MIRAIPLDLKAETLLNYYPRNKRTIEIKGSHKRSAYEDIATIDENDRNINIVIARNGIYDILPECLFHPIDRFDKIPANEYKERFREECEQQQIEEDNARRYFQPFDNILMELSALVSAAKNDAGSSQILENIICDNMRDIYINNRFVKKTKEYIAKCSIIRGNKSLLSLMLRHILFDEHVRISECAEQDLIHDSSPRYNYRLDGGISGDNEFFLGNEFEEKIIVYNVQYWSEEECGQEFLTFVKEMEIFENFINDYFIGIGSCIMFNISAKALPVRLSDETFYTYLDYNTNI